MAIPPFKDRPGASHTVTNVDNAIPSAVTTLSPDEVDRVTLSAFQSGSNIIDINHILQGVEINNDFVRFAGTQPKVGAEVNSHFITQTSFGVSKEFDDSIPYQDLGVLDPVNYLQDTEGSQQYPIILSNASLVDPNQLDGVLEPLSIREVVSLASTELPFIAKSTKGSLMDGGQDYLGRTQIITNRIEKKPQSITEPYFDAFGELVGSTERTSIIKPGFITEIERTIHPFDETSFERFLSGSIVGTRDGISNIALSMSLGVSGAHKEYGLVDDTYKSAVAGFEYWSAIHLGTDSLSFGDKASYRSKGVLNEIDCLTGSYPTIARTGDKNRTGRLPTKFDDTNTITFDNNAYLELGRTIHSASLWLLKPKLSQSIQRNSNPRYYPYLGPQNIVRVTSASLYATGTVRKGVADAFLRFTPGEEMGPFIEDFLFENGENSTVDPFHLTGSRIEDVGAGFTSQLKSKTKIEIDLNPVTSTKLRIRNTNKRNFHSAYFNVKKKTWEGIGVGKAFDGTSVATSNNIFRNGMFGFSVSTSHNSVTEPALRQSGIPISNFGFPIHPKFHATSSQLYYLSSSINAPFLLEKLVYQFSASYDDGGATSDTSVANVSTFYILNQRTGYSLTRQNFVSVNTDGTNSIFITASLPVKYHLSPGGVKTQVDTVRDLVAYAQISSINVSASSDFKSIQRRDLNLESNATVDYTGSFIMSASVKSPVVATSISTMKPNTGIVFVLQNEYGGRNGIGSPTGRDFVNSINGFEPSGSFTKDSFTITPNINNFDINPYILLPTDKLIFGWESPLIYEPAGTSATKPTLSINSGIGKLTLYGSLIKENKEFHDTLNQPLTSNAIHEVIHYDNPVLDQYDTEYFQNLSGSYLDSYITGSMHNNVKLHRQVHGSTFGLYGSQSGSFLRNAQMISSNERFYDTLLPAAGEITVLNGGNVALIQGAAILYYDGQHNAGTDALADKDWKLAYPFEAKYSTVTRKLDKHSIVEARLTEQLNAMPSIFAPVGIERQFATAFRYLIAEIGGERPRIRSGEELFVKHYFGIGDYHSGTVKYTDLSGSVTNEQYFTGAEIRGWKYGILNGLPQFTKAIFRRNHFGQPRDMLEQRLDGKFYDTEGVDSFGKASGVGAALLSPVQAKFLDNDPTKTTCSNLSSECTSSLPYFDDKVRNREEPLNKTVNTTIVKF